MKMRKALEKSMGQNLRRPPLYAKDPSVLQPKRMALLARGREQKAMASRPRSRFNYQYPPLSVYQLMEVGRIRNDGFSEYPV
jgi:hypothetical protein